MRSLLICLGLSIALIPAGCSSESGGSAAGPSAGGVVKYSGGGVAELKRLEGRRVREIELWEAPDMRDRLAQMLGPDFDAFKEDWMIESPITADGDILMAAGCDWNDNCDQNQYVMFIDTAKDNINILHFKDGQEKAYKEKGDIVLTDKFSQDLAAMKAKSGVK